MAILPASPPWPGPDAPTGSPRCCRLPYAWLRASLQAGRVVPPEVLTTEAGASVCVLLKQLPVTQPTESTGGTVPRNGGPSSRVCGAGKQCF